MVTECKKCKIDAQNWMLNMNVRYKIIDKSEIYQKQKVCNKFQKKITNWEKYCGLFRSHAVKKYWKLQKIYRQNISKSENLKEIWESESKSKIWKSRSKIEIEISKKLKHKIWTVFENKISNNFENKNNIFKKKCPKFHLMSFEGNLKVIWRSFESEMGVEGGKITNMTFTHEWMLKIFFSRWKPKKKLKLRFWRKKVRLSILIFFSTISRFLDFFKIFDIF